MPIPAFSSFQPIGYIKNDLFNEAKKILEKAKTKAAKFGVLLRYKILSGDPGHEILNFAKR